MNRPILVITLGFIIGIILGLYFYIAPLLLLFLITLTIFFKNINLRTNNKYIRVLKVFLYKNLMLIFLISICLSNIYLILCNKNYERVYNNFSKQEIIATVISNKKESEYKNTYKIKLEQYKGVNFLLRVPKSKIINLEYGDKIKISGEYILPEESRNYGGFNYRKYLRTQEVYGIFEANNIELLKHNNLSKIGLFSNNIKQKIISNINKILPEDTSQLFLGILIGYDDYLSENIQESFRKSSLTHLLAVSGAHISYIIIGINFIFTKLKIQKKITYVITILFLIFFMYITNFSASVVRASIMGMVLLVSIILFRKNDILNTISLSILMILLENPYKILDIGLLLSYFATIGIIYFSKVRIRHYDIDNEKNILQRIGCYLKELILITVYANIFVIPIMLYSFNTISFTFILSNLIAGILIGAITIGGFLLIILMFINLKLAYIVSIPYNLLLELLIESTVITSKLPLSEVLVSTPNIIIVIMYYITLLLYMTYNFFKKEYSNRYIVKKIEYFIQKGICFLKNNFKNLVISIILFIFIINFISKVTSNNLKIYFIDVGQGDSTLVISPNNKKILIDSGGAETGNFDVGKSTLVPYLLDRKITFLDYICISHFDSDHCKGFIYLLNNIKVKNIIFSKQYDVIENFEQIIKIVREKGINIIMVEEGDIITIDKAVKIRILSPRKELTNDINKNSIVMKLEFNNFSCLFTGDISKDIEQNLIKKYNKFLKSDVLKVAHHGSITSSDQIFIQTVNPKISLIGVGKNNKFGHPNETVLQTLENINSKIYRTDENGEIRLIITKNR